MWVQFIYFKECLLIYLEDSLFILSSLKLIRNRLV